VIAEADLLQQHVDVLFTRDPRGRIVVNNEPDGERAPRLYLARGRASIVTAVRHDVPEAVAERLSRIASGIRQWDGTPSNPPTFDELRITLATQAPIQDESTGPAFRLDEPRSDAAPGSAIPKVPVLPVDEDNANLLETFFPYTRSILADRQPVVGVVVDGAVVSACYSARRGEAVCEAGVDTEKAYRGRGFATAVVTAWRDAVIADGRLPLYSTSWDNDASLRVARRLGAVAYAETVSLS
jgi:RimJ/RimL family protein N-acetyltransferase